MMPPGLPAPQPPSDAEALIEAARRQVPEALGRVLEAYRPYLALIANQYLGLELRAKAGPSDLVQDTFLEAQRDFAHFKGNTEAELRAWLRRILLHNLANLTRHYRGTGKRSLSREVPLADTPLEELRTGLLTPAPSPSKDAAAREADAALERALGQLPEPARQVVHWRNSDHLSFEEIGRRLGKSTGAARKVWARAVDQLRKILEGDHGRG
jgi:RNA polymerase sigma-70 factor (ECF subfamily)